MKLRSVLFASAALIWAAGCDIKEEDKPQPQGPQITVPAESQKVFSEGISFESSSGSGVQTSVVKFTAAASWSTDLKDTKSSDWLSVRPQSGVAGDVEMNVTAQPNTGENARRCEVTIVCGDEKLRFTVNQAGAPVIKVESVTLSSEEITLAPGSKATLVATVMPENAADKTVTWSSSDEKIATVADGLVTAVAEGQAVIKAVAGDKEATCVVKVKKETVPVSSVTLNKTTLSLQKGKSEALTAIVKPDDATNKDVTWSSSDPSVASVDKYGIVTGQKSGSATIKAMAGDKSATCSVTVTTPVESITLDRISVTLEEGQTTTLVATINPSDADNKTVTWSSSNSQVATVSGGVVTAVAEGTAVITASADGKEAKCSVTVQNSVIQVTSVTLNKSTLSLQKGQSETLTATVKPTNATDKTVTWSSSDATIVSVDQNGLVSALKSGTATVMAKAGEKSATCTVTVTTPVVSVTLDRSSVTLEEGQSTTLTATISPNDADEKTVSWSSSDTHVATVSNGVVTAEKEGSAVITASAGGKQATCVITVQKHVVPVTSVTINKSTLNLKKGESETLVATVNPSDATDKTVTWSSRDASIAIVDQNGTVAALSSGTVIIEAKAGEQSANCTVTVTTPVELVTLDITSITLEEGQSTTLTATITPSDADEKTVTWTSSDTRVATVNNGVVTAVAEGNATITASAGGKEATCRVTVQRAVIPVTSVTLNKSTLSLFTGGSETLVATVTPSDATDNTVTWSSSDASVASVDQNGLVSAVKSGTATIKASAGGKEATCAVEVRDDVFDISPTRVELMAAGGTFEVKVTTYREYHINSKPDWITEKSVSNQVHTFEASANTSSEQRSGVIVFCDDKGTCLPCQIVQDASGPFTITPTSVEVEADGGQFEVTVSCSTIYHINSMPEWVEEVTPANNGKVHVFKVGKNSSEQERSGVVVFCDDQGTCLSCFVKQKPHVPDSAGGGNEDVTDGDPINW